MLVAMKEKKTPTGVKFSFFVMSAPFMFSLGYLSMLAPMAANPALVDPATFAYLCRTCIRLLALNTSFIGGIHYGIAASIYETAADEEELKHIRR